MVEVSRDGPVAFTLRTRSIAHGTTSSTRMAFADGWRSSTPGPLEEVLKPPDPKLFLEFDGMRPPPVRLEGGDASSDSYCFS